MFKRKIYKKIKEWKERQQNSTHKTALIIKGARQVGKTTIVKEFAKNEYENVVYINFMYDSKYKECFDKDLNVETIISEINFRNRDFKFVPYKTLIIFDEIQECGRARSSIKPFCLDGRFDIIATGSLLGVLGYNRRKDVSIPVGFESFLEMHAMDFEEFLWAQNYDEKHIDYLIEKVVNIKPIDSAINEQMYEEYKWYLLVGGMPAVVYEYTTTKNINAVRTKQLEIISSYQCDFGKHLDNNEKEVINQFDLAKINRIFESIPQQLSRSENLSEDNENRISLKFKFSEVEKKAKFRDYMDAIQWLKDAGIINICYNLNSIDNILEANKIDNYFKIFMNDTGLLMASLPESTALRIWRNDFGTYKGYIYENLIAEQLAKNGFKLYYKEERYSEIDFVINTNWSLFALEVKSSDGSRHSLNNLIKNSNGKIKGIKLAHKNIGLANDILTIPYYLCFLIDSNFNIPFNPKKNPWSI